MPVIPLETVDDDRLFYYRGVSDPDLARRLGLFVAEGRLVVERLLRLGRYRIESMLLTPASFSSLSGAVAGLDPAVPVFVATREHFATIAGFDFHRGCLALAHRPAGHDIRSLASTAQTVVVLDSVTDADNVGGIFRNAAAFGSDAVLLSPTTCDPLYRKAIRTSMAAVLWVPFARSMRWPADLGDLRQFGFTVVALSPHAEMSLDEFALTKRPAQRIALVLGSEGSGISRDVEREAEVAVRIPTIAAVDSLNVAVASGIALARLGAL